MKSKSSFFHRLWVLCLLLLQSSCLESSGGGGSGSSSRWIPDVLLECASAQSTDCSATGDGKLAYVGLLSDTSQACDKYLSSLTSSTFTMSFEVSGEAEMSYDGFYLKGRVETWVNSMGQALEQMPDDTYKVCVFVDSQSGENLQLDFGEPVGAATLTPDDTIQLTIQDWFNY